MKITLEKTNRFLLFSILLTVVLYYSKQLIIPVVMAAFLAMLMAPLCRKLDKKIPRVFSALSCVLILLVAILGIFIVIFLQIMNFSKELPNIQNKAEAMANKAQCYIEQKFNIPQERQSGIIKKQVSNAGKSAGAFTGRILSGITSTLSGLVITLVFMFLMLFGKERYEVFFLRVYKDGDASEISKTLSEIARVSQLYLTGRAISMSIQAVLFSTGLTILGVKNGILLGCIAALLTIFPYIGPVLGGLFPVIVTLITEDSIDTTLWVVGLLFLVQTLDNYFIEPNVVGGRVNLSALATIFIIIVGGTLWGVAGMVLFVPILGIVKIICTHIDSLNPYAYLIGDPEEKKHSQIMEKIKNLFKKKIEKQV